MMTTQTADFAGANATGAQPVFAAAQDSLLAVGQLTYELEAQYYFTKAAGITSHTMSLLFGGTHTLTSVDMFCYVQSATAAPGLATACGRFKIAVGTAIVITGAVAAAAWTTHVHLKGIIRFNAGGTFIPQYQLSVAPGGAYTTQRNSHFALRPLGTNVIASIGPWS